ncbi:ATP phosphoribosyltransferase regulatory subunit [Palleronia sp. LCG004]|uniref:ATP phosphoribosyltransferase regulatory subunit n=1 Tax=Palleronia sp. LCG004 TaxID=3079304 RepID=UPI00294308EB|nr:ATP phosphoribosyltransferase regulatory subunit [Palleronia sp. LCG004]WOI55508.1 ATP phosphoribosyltransferase regulatory subunit [Palleronia sp. LCG004]
MTRATKAAEREAAERLLAAFLAAGAERVEPEILLPAETLLDLYGEDIRTRAFVTAGPDGGEAMLRPDFTVPVVQRHMATRDGPARYAYAGEIFRRQTDSDRPHEYFQAGYEVFGDDAAEADAEVFATIHAELAPLAPRITTGDTAILTAAVAGLEASERRKAALMRHIWRPRRFRALLERFAGKAPMPPARAALLGSEDPLAGAGPEIGLRERAEIAERIEALRADAQEPPLSANLVALLDGLLDLSAPARDALERLRDIAVDLPAILPSVEGLAQRLSALEARGIDVGNLSFEGSHGRSTMEYYDGFVFTFQLPNRPDLPPLATGGRYDALTRALGGADGIRAVGGVIRPAVMLEGGA